MVRDCARCEMWNLITHHGKGTSTGWCNFNGRITRHDAGCGFYVRRPGSVQRIHDADVNVGLDVFERRQQGELPAFRHNPQPVAADTHGLRQRAARRRVA